MAGAGGRLGIAALAWACACGGGGSTPAGDGLPDRDKDGLPDAQEGAAGTKPDHPDSDGDGQPDGVEVFRLRTDPLKPDTDGDGAWDGQEVAVLHTDPLVPDAQHAAGGVKGGPNAIVREVEYRLRATEPLPPKERCGSPGAQPTCFVYVPGGTFLMGAQASDPSKPGYDPAARPEEGPVHPVTVSPYWIQLNEVQAGYHALCVEKGVCRPDDAATGGFFTAGRDDTKLHPINGVGWEGAERFCSWLGGRLPTEAEWELAARGTDGRRWPWGDFPNCGVAPVDVTALGGDANMDLERLPMSACENGSTAGIGRLRGKSAMGLMGMGGNVWEWVADRYAVDAYARHAAVDPRGPETGEARVQRGGGWTSVDPADLRAAARGSMKPEAQMHDVGFRCVRPVVGDAP